MLEEASIKSILIQKGFGIRGNRVVDHLMLGVELSTGRTVWGDCVGIAAKYLEERFLAEAKSRLSDLLLDQPVSQQTGIETALSQLQVVTWVLREIPVDEIRGEVESESKRRALIAAIGQPEPEAQLEEVEIEIPLPKAIRYALSHALYQANFEHIVRPKKASIPKLVSPVDLAADKRIFGLSDMLVYEVPKNNIVEILGKNGEKLQAHIKKLCRWIEEQVKTFKYEEAPTLLINLKGVYGELFNHVPGKILGAFFGLTFAAGQTKLILADPILHDDSDAGIKAYKHLLDLIRRRKVKCKLTMGHGIDSLDTLHKWVESELFDTYYFSSNQFGSIPTLKEAIDISHKAGSMAILHLHQYESSAGSQLWSQIATEEGVEWFQPSGSKRLYAETINTFLKETAN